MAGLIVIPAVMVLLSGHFIVRWYGTETGGLAYVLYVAYYFALILPAGVLCWLFPLLGRFEYGVGGLFRVALQLTAAHLPSTVVVVLLVGNVPTMVLLSIYWAVREKRRVRDQVEKMRIEDL